MERFDVIVVGAGPAGGETARELAKAGFSVLLLERSTNFSINNFSSGGAPLAFVEKFQIPNEVIGSMWHQIHMHSNAKKCTWTSPKPGGVIMDFSKLRAHLAKEVELYGGKVILGARVTEVVGERVQFETDTLREAHGGVIVDATGAERHLLGRKKESFPSIGIEHLLEVDAASYKKWEGALSVFMGSEWMPQGYGWIFPMERGRLKVGVGRYFSNEKIFPGMHPYRYYLDKIIAKCLNVNAIKTIDTHGKTIFYTPRRRDVILCGNVVGVGDAISMINPLAFEGIRHGMESARILSAFVGRYLIGESGALLQYKEAIDAYVGFRWRLSEFLMNRIYRETNDRNIDRMVEAFESFSFEEMMDLSFNYSFSKGLRFYLRYLGRKIDLF